MARGQWSEVKARGVLEAWKRGVEEDRDERGGVTPGHEGASRTGSSGAEEPWCCRAKNARYSSRT